MKKHIGYIAVLILLLIEKSGYACDLDSIHLKKTSFIVHFATDSSIPSPQETFSFKEFIKSLDTSHIFSISILGYCDDLGSNEYNEVLSQDRADRVRDILSAEGIKRAFIAKVLGKGELPIEQSNDKNQLRALNRRAEIIVTYKTPKKDENEILPRNLKIGDKVTLSNILFVGDRSTLLSESFPALDSLVNTLIKEKQYKIMILGHISAGGVIRLQDAPDLNTGFVNLSEARAKVIYDYLISHGIDSGRLAYKGLGGKYPTEKGDKFDRRVEIEITSIIFQQ